MLTVGSLFSGIGGFDLGLERAGMRVIWQSEIDPYASAVLRKHWPHVPNHGDIRAIHFPPVERCDVLCGGFPCQDISNAGKRAGIDGERSGLWSEFARVIGELRPQYVVVENVAALLGRGLDRVLGDLAALGFDAEWHCIPASAVGAPHRRDRLWIVAYAESATPGSGDNLRARQPDSSGRREDVADSDEPRLAQRIMLTGIPGAAGFGDARQNPRMGGAEMADATIEWQQSWRRVECPEGCNCARRLHHWITEPDVGRVADGIPRRVDRLRCLGNAIVPQIAEIIGRAIVSAQGHA